MPRRLSKTEREAFLRGRHVCVLATIGPDGQPILTPIWYLYRNGRILMRTGAQAIKTLNISRDPRVTVSVQDERPPYKSVTIYGTASIESQQPALGPKIARHYLGCVHASRARRNRRERRNHVGRHTRTLRHSGLLTGDAANWPGLANNEANPATVALIATNS